MKTCQMYKLYKTEKPKLMRGLFFNEPIPLENTQSGIYLVTPLKMVILEKSDTITTLQNRKAPANARAFFMGYHCISQLKQ